MSLDNPVSDQLKDCAGMGEPEAHFQVGGYQYRMLQIGGILSILVGAAILVLLVGVAIFGPRAAPGRELSALFKGGVFGLAAIIGGVGAWTRSRQYRGVQVLVCSNGIIRMAREGLEQIRWNEVRSIRRVSRSSLEVGRSGTPTLELIIEKLDGTQIRFDENLSGLKQLRELVEEHTLDHLLEPALERLRDGEAISFGPIIFNQQGILVGAKLVPWTDYGQGVAERGQVTLYDNKRGKVICKHDTHEVPNAHVVLALAKFFGDASQVRGLNDDLSS